jgi:hypothetical protein
MRPVARRKSLLSEAEMLVLLVKGSLQALIMVLVVLGERSDPLTSLLPRMTSLLHVFFFIFHVHSGKFTNQPALWPAR